MIKNLVIGMILLTSPLKFVYAHSSNDRNIDDLFNESAVVVNAKVTGVEGKCSSDYCNSNYNLEIQSVEKGRLEDKNELVVCSNISLDLGLQYVIFLELGQRDLNGKGLCMYSISRDGAFIRFGHRVYRYGSPDVSILIEYESDLYQTRTMLVPDFDELMNKMRDPE